MIRWNDPWQLARGLVLSEFGLDAHDLPTDAALYYAMLARAMDAQRQIHLVDALSFPHIDQRHVKRSMSEAWQLRASGPGKMARWEDTLTDSQKKAMAEVDREVEETLAKLQAKGRVPDAKVDVAKFKRTINKGKL